jgi:GNAT superfamily N-acetyltransferase
MKTIFPIVSPGIKFSNRQDVYNYVIDTFSMYYDSVDIVIKNEIDTLILSSQDNVTYFNICIHKDGELKECIQRNIPIFEKYNREPIIYITPASSYFGKVVGLEIFANDSFMFLENDNILKNFQEPDSVKIEITKDEELFIKIWGDTRKDPKDIYGVASEEMINGMRRFFHTPPSGFNHFATMAYINNKPVANVVSVYNKDFLLVVGLGTLPEYRKMGIGTALMKDIVRRADKLGIKTITLQTEAGTYNEGYYEKIGFETKFKGTYYKIA